MAIRSRGSRANPCTLVRRSLIAARFFMKTVSLDTGEFANALTNWRADDDELRTPGRDLENKNDMNSARSFDNSKIALYMSCRSRLPRRMSKIIAIRGFNAAM